MSERLHNPEVINNPGREILSQEKPLRLSDLHEDASALYQETCTPESGFTQGGIEAFAPGAPIGEVVPTYRSTDIDDSKYISSTTDALKVAGVKLLLANMFPHPEHQFEDEYALHTQFNKRMLEVRQQDLAKVVTRGELASILRDPRRTAVIESWEGIYNAPDIFALVDRFRRDGILNIHPMWNDDNEIGHGHGRDTEGLTQKGREFIRAADRAGLFIDFSHASQQSDLDMLEVIQNQPPVISHTGSRGLVGITRNAPDDVAVEVARRGGLVGVSPAAMMLDIDRRAGAKEMVDHIAHYVNIFSQAGVPDAWKRVAIGTDFDGMTPHNASRGDIDDIRTLGSALEGEMLRRGVSQEVINGILFRNAEVFYMAHLPQAA